MLLSELSAFLRQSKQLAIVLPDGSLVPRHFHVTEVGEVTRRFIDCGGTRRHERVVNLQLWSANDYDHRLAPEKFSHILDLAQRELGIGNLEVEVEYQGAETIQKFGLAIVDDRLQLTGKATDCLAKDNCGIPPAKKLVSLGNFVAKPSATSCAPGSGCC
ncbi:putative urease superfamily metal-dependent hydrolase [Lewinella aquimaris]|uniref:Putative urease superfamily metal-dependent hydrolase n=1 Tax=Neolewinella aquimaris TaxID=1835722 RepID=A0A840E7Y9_9BACT|nr:DUF6428 family protein [Neolewinella aquimaris]MBB4079397.1 putative urease superfamily metal-dependent hydrolase [Neolewinella aquimaris]